MKLLPVAQNIKEWLALKLKLVPTPLAYSHFGALTSKTLLEAVDAGVFEAIGEGKSSLSEICRVCHLNERAVAALMGVLASMGLTTKSGNLYALTPVAKKWLLKSSSQSLYWLMIFDNRVCYKWMDYTAAFLRNGKGLDYHSTLTPEEWGYYQKAMVAVAKNASEEAARKIPVPGRASSMLDIGGAHGLYSSALCARHKGLSSTVLDLPEAIEAALPATALLTGRERLSFEAGDILSYPLPGNTYDLVIMANVAHHLSFEQNQQVAARVFKSLRKEGYFVILEVLRDEISENDMLAQLGNFFYALSSTSGIWRLNDLTTWKRKAGFSAVRKIPLLSIPGYAAVVSKKTVT